MTKGYLAAALGLGAAILCVAPALAQQTEFRISYFAGAAFRALPAHNDGPSLYDVSDPLLLNYAGGDAHRGQFYRTALGNPALRPLLRRTGLPALKDEKRLAELRAAILRARDEEAPDWAAVGAPVAALMDGIGVRHPRPAPSPAPARPPDPGEIDKAIRSCAAHLLRSWSRNGFLPTYAAFNLLGDPDMGGREMTMALTGLNSRGYKNSTLLFSLARIFIAHSPARALINPPWTGIAEPMWEPMQRHRSAYYDAFFIEALLGYVESGLASAQETGQARRAIADMVDFCLNISREQVFAQPDKDGRLVIRDRVSRQDVAKMIGASREMVSRVMKDLGQQGLIEEGPDGILLRERLNDV